MDLLNKEEILTYLREQVAERLDELADKDLRNQLKTKIMNSYLDDLRDELFFILEGKYGNTEEYPSQTAGAFLIYYCWIVVSIECRNFLWKYESMDLSRRSGELWESLIKQCWSYPVKPSIKRFEAPNFEEVAGEIQDAFRRNLEEKQLENSIVREIHTEYSRVWSLLGDAINLKSDEIFETTFKELAEQEGTELETEDEDNRYIIDFKGSYGSNEKGNKERLLIVARIYDMLNYYDLTDKKYNCMLAVRTVEKQGHNYLRQLESSGLWTVKRWHEVYEMVEKFTGFDVLRFIEEKELDIIRDLNEDTEKYMQEKITSKTGNSFAVQYLTWW